MCVAAKADSPAATLAASFIEGPPNAVVVEVIWFFGIAGRDAACAWRAALRIDATCAQLEAGISAALAAQPACELTNVAAPVCALLDDAAHAALDKKRASQKGAGAVPSADEGKQADGERTTGLASAVAARLGAVLLLSLRTDKDADDDAPAEPSSPAAAAPAMDAV